jgi:predicted nucleic acid-binding protein
MKYLVDTCGWIEYLTEGVLAGEYATYLENPSALIVPTIVQYELYKWTRRAHGEIKADEAVVLTKQAEVYGFDTSTALMAADLSLEHGLAMADAIVYATTQIHRATLVTSDSVFQNLGSVKYLKSMPKR